MGLGLKRIVHVKLPVADVRASAAWYMSLLGLGLGAEFVETGELRGVELFDSGSGFGIALRDRRYCASQPDLSGFDVFAIEVESLPALHALATRWDALGVDHSGVLDRGEYGANVDVPDPDGTVVRFIANNPIGPGRFVGVEFAENQQFSLYDKPRFVSDRGA